MVAAQGDQMRDAHCLPFDQPHARRNIAQRDAKIADIGKHYFARIDPPRRMITVQQHATGVTNRVRPKAGAGAI